MPDTDARLYYGTQGPMTDPGRFGSELDKLPTSVAELVQIVQGLVVHPFWAGSYGLELDKEREGEVQIRRLEPKLERILQLDSSPLTTARTAEARLVGYCRDFSLLLVALLRRQGNPARARCGFGTYFQPG